MGYKQPTNWVQQNQQAVDASWPSVQKGAQVQQQYNRANEVNPYGSSTYSYDSNGQLVRTQKLSTAEQKKLNMEQSQDVSELGLSQSLLDRLKGSWGQGLNYDSATAIPGVNDFSADRQKVEDALYNQSKSRLDTEWGQAKALKAQEFANKGYTPGSEAYEAEMKLFNQGYNDAYGSARNSATTQAGEEQSRLFNNALTARQQQVSEANALHNQALSDWQSISGTTSRVNNPTYSTMSSIDINTPDAYSGAITTRGQDVEGQTGIASSDATVTAARIKAASDNSSSGSSLDSESGYTPTSSQKGKSLINRKGLFSLGGLNG